MDTPAVNNWKVCLMLRLHRDRRSAFRNQVLIPKLSEVQMKRKNGPRWGEYEGTFDSAQMAKALGELLQMIADPAMQPEKRTSKKYPLLRSASLDCLKITIEKVNG